MKKELVYQQQYKISIRVFFSKFPNFVAMLISAFVSNSLLVWLDVSESFIAAVNVGFVMAVSKMLTKNLKYQYNYGVEKIEAL